MPKVASYTVVRDSDLTLPDNGDIDFDLPEFGLPNLSSSTAGVDRPILSFKVIALVDNARVELYLNKDEDDPATFAQTYAAGTIRTITEVLNRDDVRDTNNALTVKRTGTGSFTISDIVLHYKADV
jgi:hypothetical protein